MLAYWYSYQDVAVKWVHVISDSFRIGNGTRQGSLLSPYLYARYIRGLLKNVHNTKIGYKIGGLFNNILVYADDIVLLAPSWKAMQFLIDVLYAESCKVDMIINVRKHVVWFLTLLTS